MRPARQPKAGGTLTGRRNRGPAFENLASIQGGARSSSGIHWIFGICRMNLLIIRKIDGEGLYVFYKKPLNEWESLNWCRAVSLGLTRLSLGAQKDAIIHNPSHLLKLSLRFNVV